MAQGSFEYGTSRARVLRSAVAPHWFGKDGRPAIFPESVPDLSSLIPYIPQMTWVKCLPSLFGISLGNKKEPNDTVVHFLKMYYRMPFLIVTRKYFLKSISERREFGKRNSARFLMKGVRNREESSLTEPDG